MAAAAAGPCILVVEDEAVVAKDLQTRLKKLGYHVPVTVPTGEEAIERARELQPSLVLMDIRLKGKLDGVQTAARIQENLRTPVIYLTAYADEGTLDRAKLTEPFGYILKPFNERELHTAIQVALHKHTVEAQLRKSERWLSAILQGMGEAVIAVDAEGRIVFMNLLAQSLTGWDATRAVGQPLANVLCIHDRQTGARMEDALMLWSKDGGATKLTGEAVLTTPDGPEVLIENAAASIHDDKGDVSGGVLVFRDVTERKRADEALRQSEEKFRLIVNGIRECAIFMLDRQGKVSSWNPGGERITGYKADEVLGKPLSIFYKPEESAGRKPEDTLAAADRHGSHQEEAWRVRKDGTEYLAEVLVTALQDSAGMVSGFVELTRDITERRRVEDQMQQVQKLESLGVLAGGVAHDFNNLLTGILANCSLVMDDLPPDDPKRSLLQEATRGCVRAAELTQQLLSYAGKAQLQTKALDISALVREISQLIRTSVSRRVGLKLELHDSLPAVEGDEGKLQQVIMNLVINAAESMNGLSGNVVVTTGLEEAQEKNFVVITVEDSGCGMDESTLSRIFDPFFTTKFQGRGLGLAAVQGIVRSHGGSLTVESKLAHGTKVKVLLPALASWPAPPPPAPVQQDLRGTEAILVVDDEETVRSVARRALERYGYTPVLVEDGAAALEVMRANSSRFDLVLLDLTMPGMSGTQVLALLREIRSDLPVVGSPGTELEFAL